MSRALWAIFAAAFLAAPIGVTRAGDAGSKMRTEQLLWACENLDPDTPEQMFELYRCIGYIDGMLEFHALIQVVKPRVTLFCLPPAGISIDQARRVFVKWAQEHPSQLHETARVSVVLALVEAFPCPQ